MGYQTITLTDSKEGDYLYKEAVKTLRTNIQFSGKDNKTILLTSCFSNEGKSDISFHLAVEMGKAGKKVLLVASDLRKSVYVSRYAIPEQTIGLSEYLSGQMENLEELIYKTNYQNVYMIMAGHFVLNPAELLDSEMFGTMLKTLRKVFDYVLVDTPPLGVVVDAAVIGQFCDSSLIVIESGAVSYKEAQKVKKQLEKSGCKVLGAVLNKIEVKSGKYYAGKYRKYAYEGYGEE